MVTLYPSDRLHVGNLVESGRPPGAPVVTRRSSTPRWTRKSEWNGRPLVPDVRPWGLKWTLAGRRHLKCQGGKAQGLPGQTGGSSMQGNRTVVGVDIAKRVFQLHWVEAETGELVGRRLTRAKFLDLFANRAPCLVGMEACGGAQHWARRLLALGHKVRLLPAKMVRPFVSGKPFRRRCPPTLRRHPRPARARVTRPPCRGTARVERRGRARANPTESSSSKRSAGGATPWPSGRTW